MKLPVDVCFILVGTRQWMGGVEYIKNCISALRTTTGAAERYRIHLLLARVQYEQFKDDFKNIVDNFILRDDECPLPTFLNRIRWFFESRILRDPYPPLRKVFKRHDIRFVYPHYAIVRGNAQYAWASWLYDFQHVHLPHFFTKKEITYRERLIKRTCRTAQRIVVSSQSARADLSSYLKKNAPPITVLQFHLLPNKELFSLDPIAVQKKFDLPDKFFIICNQLWSHKNHLQVIQALGLLKKKNCDINVVCTGALEDSRNPEYLSMVRQAIEGSGCSGQIRLLGVIDKREQIALLRRSIAMIQPSRFEGWNTGIEEARALGKRLLLSDIPVHREQDTGNCVYFSLNCIDELKIIIINECENGVPGPDLNAEQKARENTKQLVRVFGESIDTIIKTGLHDY